MDAKGIDGPAVSDRSGLWRWSCPSGHGGQQHVAQSAPLRTTCDARAGRIQPPCGAPITWTLFRADEPPEVQTAAAQLANVRDLLEHLIRDGSSVADVADAVAEQLARALAEWGKVPSMEYDGRRVPTRIDQGPQIVDEWQRWAARTGRPLFELSDYEPLNDVTFNELLRAALRGFGISKDEISSRMARLPETSAEIDKRLLACGFYDFFVQLVDVRADATPLDRRSAREQKASHAELYTAYRNFCEAARRAGLPLAAKLLTKKAFTSEIEKLEQVTRRKLAPKATSRARGWSGLRLKPPEIIKAAIDAPRLVAQYLAIFADNESELPEVPPLN
jgi:hypothetical protein